MPIYACDTESDARRVVKSTLFQSMRWMYWYELADRLRYVDITRTEITRALFQLRAEGDVDRMRAGDGRYIYRINL